MSKYLLVSPTRPIFAIQITTDMENTTTAITITIQDIAKIYSEKGWNAVRAFLKRNNVPHSFHVFDFGIDGRNAHAEKLEWLKSAGENEFRAHYYSKLVRKRSTGWKYNIIRGQMLKLI